MELTDIIFTPSNDISADDIELLEEHKNLIQNNKFSDATALLDNKNYQKGFRASFFNLLEQKIRSIQEYLLNKIVAESDEYYSYEKPTKEFMEENGYVYWDQLYD